MNPYHEKYLGIKPTDHDSPILLCPLFAYVVLKETINMHCEGLFDEFEYKLGRQFTKKLCGRIKGSCIEPAFEELKQYGLGTAQAVIIGKKNIIRNNHSSISRQYKKTFSNRKKADHLLAGMYSGILSSHLSKDIHMSEKQCWSAGNPSCIFEDSLSMDKYPMLDKTIQEICEAQCSGINNPSQLIKNAFEQGQFKNTDGMIRLWNIYSVFFRFGIFYVSNKILSKCDKGIPRIMRYLGLAQTEIAINFQRNQFGINDNEKLFSQLIEQLSLFGYGIGQIKSRDENGMEITLSDMPILRQHTGRQYQDPYLEGIIASMASLLLDKISTIEFFASGDTLSIHVKTGGDMVQRIVLECPSTEIKETIDERMKHKHYLSPD